jgi:hypothetical protein
MLWRPVQRLRHRRSCVRHRRLVRDGLRKIQLVEVRSQAELHMRIVPQVDVEQPVAGPVLEQLWRVQVAHG